MSKIQWYEVFISDHEGSQTLKNCNTLKEARLEKRKLELRYGNCIHIDKWTDPDNPTSIKEII